MLQIFPPETLSEIGQRATNEDAFYPKEPEINDSLFIVCDGVGGHEKGEVASQLICTHFPHYFNQALQPRFHQESFVNALREVENEFARYFLTHSEATGMASTLTVVALDRVANRLLLGWVGDSRIYHIRQGDVRFVSKDHSLVQDLIEQGEITEEEALYHPQRNRITRSVNGTSPARMDTKTLTDLAADDFILLCTDGLLETLGPGQIKKYFLAHNSPAEIKERIALAAAGTTKDNYSMILFKIKQVTPGPVTPAKITVQKSTAYGSLPLILSMILLGLLLWVLWYYVFS